MNQVSLVGRITHNLELRETSTGKSYVFFSIAINNINNKADFINCTAWNNVAENMVKYLGKGSMVAVTGRLTSRKDNNGYSRIDVSAINVTFLDSKRSNLNVEDSQQFQNNKIQQNNNVENIDEAFQNFSTELNFVNNNSLDTNNLDEDEAIVWDA